MIVGPSVLKDQDVVIQSQTEPIFLYYLINELKTDITLTADASEDDTVINVSSGHGFTAAAGEVMVIRNGDIFEQFEVVSVATDAITVEVPIAHDYLASSTVIYRGSVLANVNGSVTPVTFKYSNTAGTTPIDIDKVIIIMAHGSNVPDDGKFGGITALTNGVYFRRMNGSTNNYGNYKNNGKFLATGANIDYTDKAPSGSYGTVITIDIEDIFGKVLRLDPRTADTIYGVIRDDISSGAGMDLMNIVLIGSYTKGE